MTVWIILNLILSILLLLLIWALWLPIHVVIAFSHRNHSTRAEVEIRYAFGLFHMHRDLTHLSTRWSDEGPALALKHDPLKTDNPSQPRHTEWTLEEGVRILKLLPIWRPVIERALESLRRLLVRTRIQKLDVHADVGTGDASTTGVVYGILWTGLGVLVRVVDRFTVLEKSPEIEVQPHFHSAILEGDFNCILQVRAGYAIWAGIAVLRAWKRRQSDGTPDSGTDENSNGKH